MSSAYLQPNPQAPETCYPRYMNIPTQQAPADKIAALEHGEAGLVLATGLAAITIPILAMMRPGAHAVFQADLYGGTHHFILAEMERLGLAYTLVPETDPEAIAAAVRPGTTLVHLESPTNPTLKIIDLAATARAVKETNPDAVLCIDNTFATPMNQNPLDLGFDVVMHSGTKYLSGHSDLNCGAVVTSAARMKAIRETAVNIGTSLAPFDSYLLERSMKTLAVRMERHNANALAVAEYLERHPKIGAVHYPGLPSHPGHAAAARQMRGFGGMVSFELGDSPEAARAAVQRLSVIASAISLGGVESTITFPAETSHYKMTREERLAIGVTDTLARLSVGIEDVADLLEDLEGALAAL
jgi:cystathionine beta-lyase